MHEDTPSAPTNQTSPSAEQTTQAVSDTEVQPVDEQPISPVSARSKRRRSSNGTSAAEDNSKKVENTNATETPSRVGVRSSGRQRKVPQRYGDEIVDTPSSKRAATSAPAQNGSATRSARKVKYVSPSEDDGEEEVEEEEDATESPEPQPRRTRSTRAKKPSVRFETRVPDAKSASTNAREESRESSNPDDYQDGLEDLVSMQLQHDLTSNELSGGEQAAAKEGPLPEYAERFQTIIQTGLTEELRLLTQIVLEKLNGKKRVPLKGLETEFDKVNQLVEQTVSIGESNSMLLLGSRGSGKTAILDTIIASLQKSHKNDFHVVRLNGFLHTDDRLALREMWRQLGRETNTEDEAGKVSSYADTMATLLALLSHHEELFGPSSDPEKETAAKSIVIILDEFDLFVTHPRQTLLYNLFDIAQARKAPIAVLGLTTKVEVTEMLEKRVKSRFSHRYVYVPLPRSLEVFSDICFAGLNLDDDEISDLLEDADPAEQTVLNSEGWSRLLEAWRTYLQNLWTDEAFSAHLRRIYYQTKSVKEFFTSALMAISELHHSTYTMSDTTTTTTTPPTSLAIPTATTFTNQPLSCPDPAPLPFAPTVTASASPSSLPLSLLLAATRLAALYDPGLENNMIGPLALSFPAAYAEYVRLLTSAKTSAAVSGAAVTPGRVWGRDVAREAWEKLVSWGLISPVGGGSGTTTDARMFRVEISFDEVVEMAGSGGSLGRWWRDA
ncbi:origin recognition complex subunit 4 [Aspergillus homomorphus CBS 101889]|uniref:Origin recognition complex subunit 4 n=1 Tax=Aspergillus homomorphus (strain CBS 101889) TaxID=1450537 RepID=A0A395IBH4_ASPHC|nr:origin recognition complex, subunit 4 [Aspergillus homomorphus CBS 101889]RAL16438.1 origin recognition complex, subunit 4 [Aspergillus homomorphus CBS 101889]